MAAPKNPRGGKPDKIWSDAIRIAAFRKAEKGGPRRIQIAAEQLVEAAIAGDVQAMKEMGDRLEGKPTQAAEVKHSGTVTFGWADD